MVTPERYIAAIRHHGDVMLTQVRSIDLTAPVPTCPGWSVANLVGHTAAVLEQKSELVRDGYVDRSPPFSKELAAQTDPSIVETLETALVEIVEVFESSDLDRPIYTWTDEDQTASWWVRRIAHEVVIHSADAVIAAGATPTSEDWLGSDGVDECLTEFLTGVPAWGTIDTKDERFDLETPDRRWGLRWVTFSGVSPTSGRTYEDAPVMVFDDAGEAASRIAAPGNVLNYWLWGRGPLPDGAVGGDAALPERVRAYAAESL